MNFSAFQSRVVAWWLLISICYQKVYHGFVDPSVKPEIPERKDYIALGRAVIEKFIIS